MSTGYTVVLDDLQSMANTFHSQAIVYRGLKPKVTPPVADGGDAGFNQITQIIMAAIDGLHTKMADRIDEHGDLLAHAHDSYQRNEIDVHGVFEDLMSD